MLKGTSHTRHINSRSQFRNNTTIISKELKDQSKVERLVFLFTDKYTTSLSHLFLLVIAFIEHMVAWKKR